jgi:hypothetical protein
VAVGETAVVEFDEGHGGILRGRGCRPASAEF